MFLKGVPCGVRLLILTGFLFSSLACNKNLGQQMLYNKGRNLHDRGHIDQAIEVYKKVLEMGGNLTEVNYDLGVAYADKGDLARAKKQVDLLRNAGRSDLAQVLTTVISDANSSRVRKKLQGEYDTERDKENK